ncbi:uncharacterized protein LOC133202730 [Saccostrea echinata]|uniref:uncharacterized protein LOC133202730 n=1 Tax=Saccostrea echinata TaxID=191078 RepID=UPI002A81ED1C|nr:uncharacterized protein LOC133202730 [Saccostrea echinata]
MHVYIRQSILNYMEKMEDQYRRLIQCGRNEEYKQFLSRHRRDGEMPDSAIFQAVADYYDISIAIRYNGNAHFTHIVRNGSGSVHHYQGRDRIWSTLRVLGVTKVIPVDEEMDMMDQI